MVRMISLYDYLNTTVPGGFHWFQVPKPKSHTHTYCFPVFEERRVDALPVHVGFRCECGEIRNDGF